MKISQEKALVIIGVILVLLPFSGFPRDWKSWITGILGICIIYLGSLLWRKKVLSRGKEHEKKTGTFTEIV